MAVGLLMLVCLLAGNAFVAMTEWSVTSHKCDDLYLVMPVCVFNAAVYSYMLVVYFMVQNANVFRGSNWLALTLLMLSTFTWALIWGSMARICHEFYHIKYPLLEQVFRVTGIANCILCLGLTIYTCGSSCYESDDEGDDVMLTNVFFKKDRSWGPLFQKENIEHYSSGVNKWSESATNRLSQLKATLDKASEVQKEAKEQSNMLQQVTDEMKNFDAKVKKTEGLIGDQERLIGDFKVDVDKVSSQLENMEMERVNVPLSMCTCMDATKWFCIFTGVLAIYICLSFAAEKWAAMFGLTLPEWHAWGTSINS